MVPVDLEIERIVRRHNRERREREDLVVEAEEIVVEMAEPENRTLREFLVPTVNGSGSSITRPTVQANKFEIKPAII